eukprot:8529954-Alexandrium_andersonii.AAC.1
MCLHTSRSHKHLHRADAGPGRRVGRWQSRGEATTEHGTSPARAQVTRAMAPIAKDSDCNTHC